MIEYSWHINALDRSIGPDDDGHENVVTTVHYSYIADNGEGHTAQSIGTVSLSWEEDDEWIEFEDLTQSDVVGWVEDDIGEDQLAEIKSKLDANIEEEVNPTEESSSDMPWDEDNDSK
jgi:hypothetical protein